MNTSTIKCAAFVGCILMLAACQPGDDASSMPDTVEERAQARWNHLIAGEYTEAWEYFAPGYRETATAGAFAATMERRPVRWLEAQVAATDCGESRCTAVIDVTYSVPGASAGLDTVRPTREISETWIRVDGTWWFDPGN